MSEYIFVRAEGFYFIEYPDDDSARKGAQDNPGTLLVSKVPSGETIWNIHSHN